MPKISSIFRNPYLFLVICIGIFFLSVIFLNKVFYYGDIFMCYWPYRKFFAQSLANGVFPLWNPYILSGYPVFADISLALYYVPNFLMYLFPTMKMYSFIIISHFMVAAIGMYYLAKNLGLSKKASLFSALSFSLCGMMVNYIADSSRLFVVCLYPLFYLSFLNSLKLNKKKWIFISAIVLMFQFLAGHIQYVFIELLISPVFLFLDDIKVKIIFQKIITLFKIILLGTLFSAIVLIPSFEFIPFTTRSNIHFNFSIYKSFSLNPLSLVRFVFADFWGIRNQGSAWGTLDASRVGYIGFFPLLLFILTFKKLIKKRSILVILVGSIIFLIISFGTYLPFFSIFVDIIPLFKIFRNPMSLLSAYSFLIALVAGFSFDLFDFSDKFRKQAVRIFLISAIISLLILILISFHNDYPNKTLLFIAKLVGKKLSIFHDIGVDFQIAQLILRNLLIISLLNLVLFIFRRKSVLLLVLFIDLLIFSKGDLFIIDSKLINMNNSVAGYLQKNIGSFRFLSTAGIIPYSGMSNYFGNLMFLPPFSKEKIDTNTKNLDNRFSHELNMIPRNISIYYGLKTIYGEATFILKEYNKYFQNGKINNFIEDASKFNPYIKEIKADVSLTLIDLSKTDFSDETLDKLAVKYIVTDREINLTHHELVFIENGIYVYENKNVLPRAIIINNNKGEPLEIDYEDANTVRININKKGKLVLKDLYYKGWNAYVNNEKVKISIYDNIFRSVDINSDNSKIEFKFEPLSFKIGLVITLTSLIGSLFYLIMFRKK